MRMKIFFTIFLFVIGCIALKDFGQLNLVKVDLGEISYKKLMVSEEGILSAPPLAIIDVLRLKEYHCFKNMRSNRWSLAIPIMFWNQTYMDKVTKAINTVEFYQKFKTNISSLILPPSGIVAYRLNWRRKTEMFDDGTMFIDSSWFTTQFEYVLPKSHSFIIEFQSTNDSSGICNSTKRKLLDEQFQSQELAVVFMTRKTKEQNISKVFVTIADLKTTKMFNDTGCQNKEKCFVSYKYAEKWSYEVSSSVMNQLNVVHLSLQKDVYDRVLDYLCKDKVPISEIESQTITKLVRDPSNEMGCSVGKKVYSSLEKLCRERVFTSNYYYGNEQCYNSNRNYLDEVIIWMNSTKNLDDRNVFNVPVKRW